MTPSLKPAALVLVPLVAASCLLLGACGPKVIKGTNITDSPETRAVVRTVETYRKAMESLDAEAIVALVSPDYFEKNGNNNSRDNYDYEGLIQYLRSERFSKISKLKLLIVYKEVLFNEDMNEARVLYHYILNFRKPPEQFQQKTVVAGDDAEVTDNFDEQRWYSKADDNLMVLVKDGDRWLIRRGL